MKPTDLLENFRGQATYQITVKGKVAPDFMNRLNNLSVSHTESYDQIISTLTGEIEDQAALNGLLNVLFDHQYDVISVMKIGYNY